MSEYDQYKAQKQAIEKREERASAQRVLSEAYVRALAVANDMNQVVGEKNDLYITLEQLNRICMKIEGE